MSSIAKYLFFTPIIMSMLIGSTSFVSPVFAKAKSDQGSPLTSHCFLSVYSEKQADTNHYAASGWMGDVKAIKFSNGWPRNPHTGSTSMRIQYNPQKQNNDGWAGIYWLEPANNWGEEDGLDLTGAKKLTFWIRGEKGGEIVSDIFIGGVEGRYSDSLHVAIGPFDLTTEWEKFTIDLAGQDLSQVIGGFGWAMSAEDNVGGATFYLDDICFE